MVDYNIDYSFLLYLIDKKYDASKMEIKINMCCKEAHIKQSAFKYAMLQRRTFTGSEMISLGNVLGISLDMMGIAFLKRLA